MADSPIVDALKATDLFSSLNNRALSKIARYCHEVDHPAGKEITTQGADGIGLHLITKGTASVSVNGAARPTLGPGQYFGEISLIDGKPRSATVVADEDLTTISLSAWNFKPILDEEPEVGRALLLALCARLRSVEQG